MTVADLLDAFASRPGIDAFAIEPVEEGDCCGVVADNFTTERRVLIEIHGDELVIKRVSDRVERRRVAAAGYEPSCDLAWLNGGES